LFFVIFYCLDFYPAKYNPFYEYLWQSKNAERLEDEATAMWQDGELKQIAGTITKITDGTIYHSISISDHSQVGEEIKLLINDKSKYIEVASVNTPEGVKIREKFIQLDNLMLGEDIFVYIDYDNVVFLIEKPVVIYE